MGTWMDATLGKLGFGCMRLPKNDDELDMPAICAMFDAFLEAGFNYFDTAHVYLGGQSEVALRECLVKRHPRNSFFLADKLSNQNFEVEEDIDPLLDFELETLGVDHMDMLLLHAQNATNYEKYTATHAYEHAFAFKAAGKTRYVGMSFHDSPDVLERILNDHPDLDAVQLQVNWADWESASVQSRACVELCAQRNIPVIVMEPLKGGNLVSVPEPVQQIIDDMDNPEGLSNAGLALRFAATHPSVAMVLSGMRTIEDVRDNVRAIRTPTPLSKAQAESLQQAAEKITSMGMIACTACHYCTDGCPEGIRIPEMLDCLNTKRVFGGWNPSWYYNNSLVSEGHAKASECLHCGICEEACPQFLPIRDLLEEVASELEGN